MAGTKDAMQAARLRLNKISTAVALLMGVTISACSLDGLLKSDELPPEVSDPAVTRTHQGALAAYAGTVAQFRLAFAGSSPRESFVGNSGMLSDELQSASVGSRFNLDIEDIRAMPGDAATDGGSYSSTFSQLQRTRGQATQALGLLAAYVPETPALAGHIYALQGYTEVFLAELFCSGIPLSTLDYNGDYTLRSGSRTDEVFEHTVALFDSALALAGDNIEFMHLARIGKARALMGLDRYAEAAAIVSPVPDDYNYAALYAEPTTILGSQNFAFFGGFGTPTWPVTVSDREGENGLDYRASNDPRVRVTIRPSGGNPDGAPPVTIWHPDKYGTDGATPVVVASGLEARLIEAEAALQENPEDDTWLTKLNALRTNGSQNESGVYNAGIGGVAGLAPLADPGTAAGRVDLLFRERAFWLFLTGHRQGDMRRLIRQYERNAERVYPTGAYPGLVLYGTDVTAPIPASERVSNLHFTGCFSRGA